MEELTDVYVASCILSFEEEFKYKVNFYLDKEEDKYRIDEENRRFTYFKDWIFDEIPMDIKISSVFSNLKATQGFDHKPTEKELEEVKKNMIDIIIKKLNKDMEYDKKTYEAKFKALNKIKETFYNE